MMGWTGGMGGMGAAPIRGWLLVLCLLLLVWQPISFALVASSTLNRLAFRGWPFAILLLLRVVVTAFGIAAGLALVRRHPAAVTIAKASLVASAATDVFVYTTPYFPNNRMPGDTTIVIAVSLAYHAIWLTYLFRSRRVRNTYSPPTPSCAEDRRAGAS
jgi:hypothetical protein